MAKSWKKFIPKPEETKGTGLVNENTSPEPLDFQKIIAQDEALAKLVKERDELEKKLKSEISNTQPSPEEQRYFNHILTFAEKKKNDQQWLRKKQQAKQKRIVELKQKKKEEAKFGFNKKLKNDFDQRRVENKLKKANLHDSSEEKPKKLIRKESAKSKILLQKEVTIFIKKDSITKVGEKANKSIDAFAKRDLIKDKVKKDKKFTDPFAKRDSIKTTVEKVKKSIDPFTKKEGMKNEVERLKTPVKKVKELLDIGKLVKKKVEKDTFELREQLKKKTVVEAVKDFSMKKSPNIDQIRDELKNKKIFEKVKEKTKPIEKVKEKTIKIKDDWEKIKEKKKEILKIKESIKDKFDKGFEVEKLLPMDNFKNSFDKPDNLDAINEKANIKDEEKIAEEKKEKQKEERLLQRKEERRREEQEERKREERKERKKDKFND